MKVDVRGSDSAGREGSVRSRTGRTLRHWTTNGLAVVGKATTRMAGRGDWGLADSRQRNLVASKLRALSGGVGVA